ncbi:hypothetical protein A2331_02455 [Candidatus Falkowbacteria bacterium RIFOXYB2_FULL_34_18]|uniref:Uncharacterized protein n=1 Tax=Candidatus Falkowbacteria bacterium RIFOXYD2_FULL_34_120 TaxID=1798007 RepID=A0A1F5TT22_9BACT|nr:MAG: hypothetical protein A2331_02455 [Candidatus Falkowbacteria bacterium RIFOXYB2_FULL_34_18]OGF29678.1 MAG: hypothetical protein A2500_00170 [Candidatus Falkowbacteria bacterium RIFOXYC12_FULL_34_55]OGF37301.1 MAG: hypothetical protein A2466_04885 [Candidatus Falkowbacteria bacterium RIFOXYC2_FULL_34_220]OGF39182.1 MAG: hypothetical protein A2515_00505 [Candidatus Falkowbacteria bacterium RIFOXYD12_FULL_34_57]OGF41731.1 MAG: hypothetical protein A2531_06225 [Candidatus Falkowbacteria bact
MKEFKEDWQLSEAEKKENYVNNLKLRIETITESVHKLHFHHGHEQDEIKDLPEEQAKELYKKLEEDIQQLIEVKNNLEKGNSYLIENKK